MAAKRSRKTSKKVSDAFEQAMVAEGAPAALDLMGFGSTIADLIRGRPRKTVAKPRLKKKALPKTKVKARSKTVRAKKKTAAKSRRKK